MARFALDSNFMAYAEGVNDRARQERAAAVIRAVRPHELVVPIQAIGELVRVLLGKLKINRTEATSRAAVWLRYPTQDTSRAVLEGALDLAARHSFGIWDSIVLSAAAEG